MPSFLAPLFLLGSLAAAIPVILHFLKREPEARVRFAAVRLLRQGPVEHDRHRRLRELLLLILRVIALLLLAAAFARPFLKAAPGNASAATIIALDTSLSMSAAGQLERGKQLARDVIGRAASGQRFGVVTFAETGRVASPVSGDRGLALAAIDAATSDAGATRYRSAVQAAVDLLPDSQGTIVVVTDLQESGWDSGDRVTLPETVIVEVADVGAPPSNLAIANARLAGERLLVTVRNAGPAREARVAVSTGSAAGSAPLDQASASTMAGAQQTVDVELSKPVGDTATLSLIDPGGIAADNNRYVVFRGTSGGAVLVVTENGDLGRDAFYVQQALSTRGRAGTAGPSIEGASAASLATWDSARLAQYSAVILSATRGLERRGRDLMAKYVAAGGGVLVPASARVDGEVVVDALGAPSGVAIATGRGAASDARHVTPLDLRHPLFEAFDAQGSALSLATFNRIAALRGPGCQPLAQFTTGEVAILDCPAGEGRALLLAFDLDNEGNDLPKRPSFVPFVHEAIRYLSSSKSARSEYIVGEQPTGVPRTPGLTLLPAADGKPARWVAVNVDPGESDQARLTVDEFQSAIGRVKGSTVEPALGPDPEARRQEDRQRLWQYALGFVFVALGVESIVASRT